jgi:lipoprotein-anchoring transpeptidase ErfK/SrfK
MEAVFPRHRASPARGLLSLACVAAVGFASADARGAVLVATVKGKAISVYAAPGGQETHRLASPNGFGVPRVLLVTGRRGGWLRTLLPVRPNGATGWVRATSVRLGTNDYAVLVERRAHRLTVTRGDRVLMRLRAGVGSAKTPTPLGLFYVTESLQIDGQARSYYGPYALGLSGFSNVLSSFNGGPGQLAIHGTGDPSTIGRSASNGCIHLSNPDLRKLAELLPLGTPVSVVR